MKWTGVIIILMLWTPGVEARGPAPQVLMNGTRAAQSFSNQEVDITGDTGVTGVVNARRCLVSPGGIFRDLRVNVAVAPGAANSYIVTLFTGSSSTSLTCTISGSSSTTCQNTTSQVSVVSGTIVYYKLTIGGTPVNVKGRFSVHFLPTLSNQTLQCSSTRDATLSTTATQFVDVAGDSGSPKAAEADARIVMPTAGTFLNFYVVLAAAPGAGTTRVFTVMKNNVATTVTCTVSGTATTCQDTVDSFTVVAGDTTDVQSKLTGTPVASRYKGGLTFMPTVDGEWFVTCASSISPTNTATTYTDIDTTDVANATTETDPDVSGQVAVVKNIYVKLQTAPGAGTSYQFNFRKNATSIGPTVTISGAGTDGNNATSTTVANDDLLVTQVIPTGTPAASKPDISYLCYTSPRRVVMVE